LWVAPVAEDQIVVTREADAFLDRPIDETRIADRWSTFRGPWPEDHGGVPLAFSRMPRESAKAESAQGFKTGPFAT